MANIAVTTSCNLRCPYCFADEMLREAREDQFISLEQFKTILEWLSRTPKNFVGLIGGEPTLHPRFGELLDELNRYFEEFNTGGTLFTNGILLDRFIDKLGDRLGLLINCNPPENMTEKQREQFHVSMGHLEVMGRLKNGAACGVNLHMGREDYGFTWELAERYHLEHLRVSVAAPAGRFASWRNRKDEYYTAMKPIFLRFCREAKEREIKLGPDCNHIPACYFTEDEMEMVASVLTNIPQDVCDPVVDITPDFKATACFGSYDPVDCSGFENLFELERYLMFKKSYPRVCANGTGKCAGCERHERMSCQGGCLGFAGGDAT